MRTYFPFFNSNVSLFLYHSLIPSNDLTIFLLCIPITCYFYYEYSIFLNVYESNNVEKYDSKIPFRGQDFISNICKFSLVYNPFLNLKNSSRRNYSNKVK